MFSLSGIVKKLVVTAAVLLGIAYGDTLVPTPLLTPFGAVSSLESATRWGQPTSASGQAQKGVDTVWFLQQFTV